MSEASPTKQKLDEFRMSLPPGDEHTEPTREMLRVTSYACNGAPDKQQALADAVGGIALFLATVHKGEHDRIMAAVKSAIDAHAIQCCKTTAPQEVVTGRVGEVAARFIVILTPWRWPIAFACFSPYAGDVAERVIGAIARFGV